MLNFKWKRDDIDTTDGDIF